MVTDGVTEAANQAGQQFGSQRLLEVVKTCLGRKPAYVADTIVQNANTFCGLIRRDDVTVVVVQVNADYERQLRDSEMCAVPVGT
jgi:phosphoserine phosphatase RsbU/P